MEKDQTIATTIRTTYHDIKIYLDRYVNSRLSNQLTGIEGLIIGYILDHDHVCACDIMKRFHLQKGTVSEAFSKLSEKGFIKVKIDESDKRKKNILLTSKGKEVHEEFKTLYESIVPEIEKGISEEDKAVVLRVCEQIKKNVGGDDDE